MNTFLKQNENGFSLVELVVVVIIVAALGLSGFYVFSHRHKATSPQSSSNSSSNPVISNGQADSEGEITYGDDGYVAKKACGGPSSQLHYTVFKPTTAGSHPIVFGML